MRGNVISSTEKREEDEVKNEGPPLDSGTRQTTIYRADDLGKHTGEDGACTFGTSHR